MTSGEVGPESFLDAGGLVAGWDGVAATDVEVERGGVDLSSAFFLAFILISCCLVSSLARMGRRSAGTSVWSLKFCANFFRSLSFTALSFRAALRWCSWIFSLSFLLNSLNASATSFSTVAVAPPSLLAGRDAGIGAGTVGLTAAIDGIALSAGLLTTVAGAEASFATVGLATSAIGASALAAGAGELGFGFAKEDDMIAGSTGAPGTVACPVGARIAGGVYLFAPPAGSGLYSR